MRYTITPVQQGMFVTCALCQIRSHTKHSRPRPSTNITDCRNFKFCSRPHPMHSLHMPHLLHAPALPPAGNSMWGLWPRPWRDPLL